MENTLKIHIDCDNSAFGEGNDWRREAARILRGLARHGWKLEAVAEGKNSRAYSVTKI